MINLNLTLTRLLLPVVCLVILATPIVQAESLQVPGTTITMDPPPGFTLAGGFSGFENLKTNSSITVMELPATAYPELSKAMATKQSAAKALASQDITVTERSTAMVEGKEVPIIEGQQPFRTGSVTKYFTLLDGDKTVLVTFNIFDNSVTPKAAAIESFESINFVATPTMEEQLSLLPFEFDAKPPFKAEHIIGGISVVMPTFEGTDPTGLKPLVIISAGLQPVDTTQLKVLSESLFRNVQGFKGATILTGEAVTLPGGESYMLEGQMEDKRAIQYVWPKGGTGFVRMIAVGGEDQIDSLRGTVSEIAQTVVPKS